jgi:hypothetical protein
LAWVFPNQHVGRTTDTVGVVNEECEQGEENVGGFTDREWIDVFTEIISR